jgi:hypothetical protein
MRSFMICTATQYCEGDKIENNAMGETCSMHGGAGACAGVWWGKLRERHQLGDPSVDWRIILRRIFWK